MTDAAAVTWDDDGAPRSARYGDVYFSKDGGLAESRAVFLAGCGLPDAWAARKHFTIAELGFGTGLNIVAALDLWRRTRPPGGLLHIFSVEAHPLSVAEARRALAAWPEVGEAASPLLERWPGRARGIHRVDLPALDAVLDLAVMDVEPALRAWSGRADAWFLDGFAPATNPAMWTPAALDLVARRSRPGARAATYTVAGAVRRGLAAAGFTVTRAPGFGRKRQRLEAVLPGAAAEPAPPRSVAIVGAGIAGASLARAFRAAAGVAVTVLDPGGAGAGASGNPAALVTPRLDAGLGDIAGLFAAAFRRATVLYDDDDATIIARGALQLERAPRDARRFAAIAASDLFEEGALRPLGASETTARLGEPAPAGLLIADGLVVEPARLLPAWLGEVRRNAVHGLAPAPGGGWRILGEGEKLLLQADVVCLAAGLACGRFAAMDLSPVRGQASLAEGVRVPSATAFGGYVIPTRTGALFGATHDRGERETDVRQTDQARNLATLSATLPALAATLAAAPLGARAGVRATTPDHLPLCGALSDQGPGLFVLSGLGSRGFALAPLLAEHVAALATQTPSPVASGEAALVEPGRIRERARRRSRLGRDAPDV